MSKQAETNGIINSEALLAVHDSMLDGLSQLAAYFGFSKVMGQLYGALFLSAAPLSLDDLMERLDISKASVSMNMKTLEHMGMVRQVWVKGGGGRRKYYEAETDFLQIITSILSGREMRDVERAISVIQENTVMLQKAVDEMNDSDRHTAEVFIERMAQMQTMFKFAQILITQILQKVSDLNIENISQIDIG